MPRISSIWLWYSDESSRTSKDAWINDMYVDLGIWKDEYKLKNAYEEIVWAG